MERRQFLKVAATGTAATLASAYGAVPTTQAQMRAGNAEQAADAKAKARRSTTAAPRLSDPALWQARWDGLRHAIMVTRDSFSDYQALFRALLINLDGFAAQQVGFYLRKLSVAAGVERPPATYSNEFALDATLNQVGFDLAAITHAAGQRRVERFRGVLERADALAELTLQPAVKAGLFRDRSDQPATPDDPREPKPIVLTYFQRLPTMRVIPYAPIALIGLPYTTSLLSEQPDNAAAARDLVAVAQEVGRLVFWKGHVQGYDPAKPKAGAKFSSFLNRTLRRDGRSPFIADGAEQIVADSYAARVAGLPAALAAQDKAVAHQLDRYYADYLRYYVLPEVRPEISIQALQSAAPKAAQQLQARWQGLQAAHFGEAALDGTLIPPATLKPYSDGGELSLDSVEYELSKSISHADRYLARVSAPDEMQRLRVDAAFDVDGRDLFNRWREVVAKAKSIRHTLSELGSYGGDSGHWTAQTWRNWATVLMQQEREQQAGHAEQWPSVADLEWLTVLYAGGWVMESPGNSGGPH